MRLQKAIEVASGLKAATDGQSAKALGYVILAAREKLEAVQEEAASIEQVLRRALPSRGTDRLAAWKHLRAILRISVDTANEVELMLRSPSRETTSRDL